MDRLQISPHFIDTPLGQLYTVHYAPPPSLVTQGYIIHIPAFAEEMNKSRHIVSKQARQMAEQGWQVVVFDLSGTGDSGGVLEDIDWTVWLSNIRSVFDWVVKESLPIVVWGLRLGVCLAVDFLNNLTNTTNTHLLIWQPVVKGKPFIQQFLRVRLAADLMSNQTGETVKLLREKLAQEGRLEVAGYSLPYVLSTTIDQLDLTQQSLPPESKVIWIEMIREEGISLPMPSQKTMDVWQQTNCLLQAKVLSDPFWSTQELVSGDEFIFQTNKYLRQIVQHHQSAVETA